MKIKICGQKENISEVAKLEPDYLGFIFWDKSKRYFNGQLPEIHSEIKKIGVFVDTPFEEILKTIKKLFSIVIIITN